MTAQWMTSSKQSEQAFVKGPEWDAYGASLWGLRNAAREISADFVTQLGVPMEYGHIGSVLVFLLE